MQIHLFYLKFPIYKYKDQTIVIFPEMKSQSKLGKTKRD